MRRDVSSGRGGEDTEEEKERVADVEGCRLRDTLGREREKESGVDDAVNYKTRSKGSN